ncbi:MAG TPA: serine/threonine-protein kinase [Thermoanaerobaculia bacterium]|nr:serine/threonine-protein kinase [Thermoanaerobaculia bacterium]
MSDAERWARIDWVFDQALDRSPDEQRAFLDQTCAGDAELRREVERLLDADESSATFLERPAGELFGILSATAAPASASVLASVLASETEGSFLGPYRLLRRIGGGGMGTVYLACREDEHYQREVAVKILRSGLESTEAYHRFLAERQILARLEHPNIARLYDGGSTQDGRPYLVMELVEGLPVDEYCNRHRLSVDQRLELFRRICSAVQYAHQNLLVHRDLKPGNILVTGEGEPKLLDFGIAKRLEPQSADPQSPDGADRQEMTQTGLRVMTPSHASPEQVKGEAVTTASDVYSLGVILYELLAGRSPYRVLKGLPHEIERAICEEEPERPGAALFRPGNPPAEEIAAVRKSRPKALERRLRGDLDNIVLMALRKEAQRRYGSAAQLSRDLENHLQSLPVAARPDALLYRGRKFLRRHRAGAAAAAVVALVVLGFLLSLISQRRQVVEERDKARYALSFLVDTFKQADPYQTRRGQLTAREILDQGEARVSRELAGRPDVQAALMGAIGEVDYGLGRYDEAEPLLERALALRLEVYGPESLEAAESLELLGRLKAERADRSEIAAAEKLLRRALALKRRLLGNDSIEVAATLNQLGSFLSETNATPDVEKLHREALAIARQVEGPVGPTVGKSLVSLAKLKRDLGDYEASERLFREGLSVERRALGERDPRLYRDQTTFGEILIDLGKFKESETLLRQSLAAQQKILGGEHPDVDASLNNLALAVHRQGRYAEAEVLFRRVLKLVRAHYGPSHSSVGAALANLAGVLDGQFRSREAIPYLQEALAIRRQAWGDRHPLVAQALLLLAGAHRKLDELGQALSLARQAQAILEEAEGPDHPHVAYALREIGNIYMKQKRYAEAEPYMRRAYEIRLKELPPESPDLARAKLSLARCLVAAGRLDEAEALVRDTETMVAAEFKTDPDFMKMIDELKAKLAQARTGARP